MTIRDLGAFALELYKSGRIEGDYKLSEEHFSHLILLSYNNIIEQKKINRLPMSQSMAEPKEFEIDDAKVILPKDFTSSTIKNILLIDKKGDIMCDFVSPIQSNQINLVCDSFSTYSYVTQNEIGFLNLPTDARKALVYIGGGSSIDDEISMDVAFMALNESFKLVTMATPNRNDAANNMNGQEDYIREQLQKMENNPNNIN